MVLRDQVRLRDEFIEIKVTSTVCRMDMQGVIDVFQGVSRGICVRGVAKDTLPDHVSQTVRIHDGGDVEPMDGHR